MKYRAIVIGGSAGSFDAINKIFKRVNNKITIPIIVVFHLSDVYDSELPNILEKMINNNVSLKEAEDKEKIIDDVIYIAPSLYHLQIESNFRFSLLDCEKINYSRPSIDVLFETAAEAYDGNLVGVLLTGANSDGARGMKRIEDLGGKVIVQNPETAYSKIMPESAIKVLKNPTILNLREIGACIDRLIKDEV